MRTTLFLSVAAIFALLTVSCGPNNKAWEITQNSNEAYDLQLAEPLFEDISVRDFNNTTIATDRNLTNLFIFMDRDLKPRVEIYLGWSGEVRPTYEIQPSDCVTNLFSLYHPASDSTYKYTIENNRNITLEEAGIRIIFSKEESKAIIRFLHQGFDNSRFYYMFNIVLKKQRLIVNFSVDVEDPIMMKGFEENYQKFIEKNKDLEYDEYTGMFKKR